jgi:hypothetical protein
MTKDENGHLIATEPVYYKLPVSATDSTFEDHKNRIEDIEDRLNKSIVDKEEKTYEDII